MLTIGSGRAARRGSPGPSRSPPEPVQVDVQLLAPRRPPRRGPRPARRRAGRWPRAGPCSACRRARSARASIAAWSSRSMPSDGRRRSRPRRSPTARRTPWPPYRRRRRRGARPPRAGRCSPPTGRSPGPAPPSEAIASTSTVGRPRESSTSRAIELAPGSATGMASFAGIRRSAHRLPDGPASTISAIVVAFPVPSSPEQCRPSRRASARSRAARAKPADGVRGRRRRGSRPGSCRRPGPGRRPPRGPAPRRTEVGGRSGRPVRRGRPPRTARVRSRYGPCPRRGPEALSTGG